MSSNYSIEITDYGLKLRSEGFFFMIDTAMEWSKLYHEKLNYVTKIRKEFGQLVDIRGFRPASLKVQNYITNVMKSFKEKGGQRSGVILNSAVAKIQIKRLAKETGIYEWERYIDTETYPDNFEQVALDWVIYGKDPDA